MRLSQTDFNRIIDLACDGVSGWKLHELGARPEDVLRMPLDLIPFPPPNRHAKLIEARGKVIL